MSQGESWRGRVAREETEMIGSTRDRMMLTYMMANNARHGL